MAYLDFAEISRQVGFKELFDRLGMPYEETEREIKAGMNGKTSFIVSKGKNLFLCPYDDKIRGSVINFLAHYKEISLRDAADELFKMFLCKSSESKRDIPDLKLHYTPILERMNIDLETAQHFEVGLVKEKSIMAKKIAFLIRDKTGNKVGYVGWDKSGWFFPKGHKQAHLYNLHRVKSDHAILVASPFEVIRLTQLGFHNAIALISGNMTAEQHTLLLRYKRILVLMAESDNIRNRIAKFCFVKAPEFNGMETLTEEEVQSYY